MAFKSLIKRIQRRFKGDPDYPVLRPLDTCGIEILAESAFQNSCRSIDGLSLLDTPRLANLWMLCRMSNPAGNIIEVGSFKGGGALHLSNCAPGRKVIICDSFQGFPELDAKLDHNFSEDQFKDTSLERVDRLFRSTGRPYEIVAGFFPGSATGRELGPISFAHLDADTYKSTADALEFLSGKFIDRSLIVLDDFFRRADGVNEAVREFTVKNRSWSAFPLFPSQGLMIHKSWFEH